MPLVKEKPEHAVDGDHVEVIHDPYDEARVALQETLASASMSSSVEVQEHGKKLLAQVQQSKEALHIPLMALTRVLVVVNQTMTTQTLLNANECMRYYRTRLALEDTLAKQQKNQVIRVSGKSILEQIVRLKGSTQFPLAELSTVLAIIDEAINAQPKNDGHVASLIQYYQARLALQETLNKQRVNRLHQQVGEAIIKQIEQLRVSSHLLLDELTESLEAANKIINIHTRNSDYPEDRLYYEQARLRLRATLTDPKTEPLLIPFGARVLAKTKQLKKDAQRTIPLSELTQVLELSHQAIKYPSIYNAQAGLAQCSKIAPRTNRQLHAALLGLFGAVILIASVGAALVSFGIASPVSLVGITIGVSLIAETMAIGAGAVGAGIVGRSLFSLFRSKPIQEQLKGEMAQLSKEIGRLVLNR